MSENNESEQLISRGTQRWEIDLDNRDPKQINETVIKVDFEDVIAEPEDLHSPDIVWKFSYHIFRWTKYVLYCILTTILGLPLSLVWALLFALLSFLRIWIIVPCIKICQIIYQSLVHPALMVFKFFINPVFEAAGKACKGLMGLRKGAVQLFYSKPVS